MKKVCLFVVLAFIMSGVVFAESGGVRDMFFGPVDGQRNWISGEVSLLGIGVRYERMLSNYFSVGGTAFLHSFLFFWNSVGIQATARWYPWASNFYTELGLGYGYITTGEYDADGIMITPGIGWRINLGRRGFFINPMIAVPITVGNRRYHDYRFVDGVWEKDSQFGTGLNIRPAIGFGFAF